MQSISQKLSKVLVSGLFAVLVMVATAIPQANAAAGLTSGGATVHNAVVVTYNSGATTFTAVATVDVAVNTVASVPNITTPTGVTALPGDVYAYVYRIVSTANGPDTYTPNGPVTVSAGATTGTAITQPNAVTLWGGVVLSTVGETINVPAGTTGSLVAGTSIISVNGVDYTVTAITAGTVATTNPDGTPNLDTNDVLTLAPVSGALVDLISAVPPAPGTQTGEVGQIIINLTAGAPNTPGVDGTPTIPAFTVTTTQPGPVATPGTVPPALTTPPTTPVITTVSSPNLTITKQARNITVNPAAVFAATGVSGAPGEVLEYQIVVTNNHATATATSVSISDAIPVYTVAVAGAPIQVSSTLGGAAAVVVNATAAADADAATIAAGTLTVNLGTGATPGSVATALPGSFAAGDTVTILYQVTIQ